MSNEKKQRKGSTIGTLKSFNNTIEKLKELKMCTKEEHEQLSHIKKIIFERWQSVEMGIMTQHGDTTK